MPNILNFNENSMRKSFSQKYTRKTFFKRYIVHYNVLLLPEIAVLLISALLSLKWWQYLPTIQDYFGSYALPVAIVCTLSISLAIWLLTAHQLPLILTEKKADVFLLPLLALIVFNFYTDWHGVPQLAAELHKKPTYQTAKEESLNEQIQNVYAAYRWCSVHNSKHDCPSAIMPASPGQIKDSYQRWGFKPAQDRQTILTLQNQLNRMNSDYNEQKQSALLRQERFTDSGRGGTIACMIIFLFITCWRHHFEYKAQLDIPRHRDGSPREGEARGDLPPTTDDLTLAYKELLKSIRENQQKFQNMLQQAKNYAPTTGNAGTGDLDQKDVVQNRLNDTPNTTNVIARPKGRGDLQPKPSMLKKQCEADSCGVHFWYDASKQQPNPRKYCSENCKNNMSSKMTKEKRERRKQPQLKVSYGS